MSKKHLNTKEISDIVSSLQNSDHYTSCASTEDWELGIDEAGRGPALGPMVYGCCCWPISLKETLSSIGFFDSKQVTKENREYFYGILQQLNKKCLYIEEKILHPAVLSDSMLRTTGENLNQISYSTVFFLIKSALSKLNILKVYVDTVGKPQFFTKLLEEEFALSPQLDFTATEKADAKFPVVSAASIVAKVNRDYCVENWQFKENSQISRNFGSGYPSDPYTVKWLEESCDQVFGYGDFVRYSWKTIQTLLEKKARVVEFEIGEKDGDGEGGRNSWISALKFKEKLEL